ncbi:MAG: DUF4783 domain-containing protein [Saprospiraceae bacterium]|nr:DUF4783 domain-containing protein [Saprospiraceae bacterium]
MKQLLFLLLVVPVASQSNLNSITQAISKGDASTLGQFLDKTVEIAVIDREDIYTRSEAERILNDFFNIHEPKSFSQVHKGSSKARNSLYCIGNLVTGKREIYRVYIYMRVDGDEYVIQELRFDKE